LIGVPSFGWPIAPRPANGEKNAGDQTWTGNQDAADITGVGKPVFIDAVE